VLYITIPQTQSYSIAERGNNVKSRNTYLEEMELISSLHPPHRILPKSENTLPNRKILDALIWEWQLSLA
jgi:hypothetical protein